MARRKFSVGGDAEVTGARAARVWAVCAAVNFTHGIKQVRERIALAGKRATLELVPAIDHFAQHNLKVCPLHFAVAAGRAQHRRKTNAVESGGDELVERAAQLEIARRYRHPCRYLHASLAGEYRLEL